MGLVMLSLLKEWWIVVMFLPPWLYDSMRSGHFFVKVSFFVTVIVKAKFQVC